MCLLQYLPLETWIWWVLVSTHPDGAICRLKAEDVPGDVSARRPPGQHAGLRLDVTGCQVLRGVHIWTYNSCQQLDIWKSSSSRSSVLQVYRIIKNDIIWTSKAINSGFQKQTDQLVGSSSKQRLWSVAWVESSPVVNSVVVAALLAKSLTA